MAKEIPLQISYTSKGSCFVNVCFLLFSYPLNPSEEKKSSIMDISWRTISGTEWGARCDDGSSLSKVVNYLFCVTLKENFQGKKSNADLKTYWRWCSTGTYNEVSSVGRQHHNLAIIKAYQNLISYPLRLYSSFTPTTCENYAGSKLKTSFNVMQ